MALKKLLPYYYDLCLKLDECWTLVVIIILYTEYILLNLILMIKALLQCDSTTYYTCKEKNYVYAKLEKYNSY